MNSTLLMIAAMLAYSLPSITGLLMWKFETPSQRVGTSIRVLVFQGVCMLFWSYAMVNPDAFGMVVIAQGMLIPTLALGVLGWSKLTPTVAFADGAAALGQRQMRFSWTHSAIAWAMMQAFIVFSFYH